MSSAHSSFSKPSVALPTSQLILQTFFCISYITVSSLTSPGEPPMYRYIKSFIYEQQYNLREKLHKNDKYSHLDTHKITRYINNKPTTYRPTINYQSLKNLDSKKFKHKVGLLLKKLSCVYEYLLTSL